MILRLSSGFFLLAYSIFGHSIEHCVTAFYSKDIPKIKSTCYEVIEIDRTFYSHYFLGWAFLNDGDFESNDLGHRYLVQASLNQVYGASDYLGYMYENGVYVDKNYAWAKMYYLHAAVQGVEARSYLALGRLYTTGKGVDKDIAKAINYFEVAAYLGNPEAFFLLWISYKSEVNRTAWKKAHKKLHPEHYAKISGDHFKVTSMLTPQQGDEVANLYHDILKKVELFKELKENKK